jgi:hypothetical protein
MSTPWNDFVTASLLGSEKSALPALPPVLESFVPASEDGDNTRVFLLPPARSRCGVALGGVPRIRRWRSHPRSPRLSRL